ncbi:hypothetical protein GNF85_06880 [Clostridium perfringens]
MNFENSYKKLSISEICTINPSKNEIKDIENIEVSFIPMNNVSENGKIDASEKKYIEEVKSGFTYFKDDDILFAKITPCMENGKGAVAKNLLNGIGFGSTEFHILRPNKDINSKWLYYITKYREFRKIAEINMTGSAGQKRVPKSFFEKYKILVPQISVQDKIVEALDKSQDLIDKRKKQIEELDLLVKSKFIEMFGDPVINKKGWKVRELLEVATLLNGRAYKQDELLDEGKTPVLRVGNFFSNRNWFYSDLELDEEKYCYNGDLLYAWSASFGPKIWDGDRVIYHYHIWKLVVDENKINKIYLYWILNILTDFFKSNTHGATMLHLTKVGMEKNKIILPSLDLQNQFEEFVKKVDKLKFEMEKSLKELEDNFNSLMQKAFKGELFQ